MTAPGATPAATRWGLVVLAISTGVLVATYIGKVPPSLPLLRAELGIDLVAAGWVVSMFNLMGALLGILAGSLGDRLGMRRVVLYGLAALTVGGLLGAASGSATALLASRFLEGLGFITVAVAAPGLIVRHASPRDLRLTLGIWSTYMPTGAALALLSAPLLLPTIGWRGLWLVLALLTATWWWLVRRNVPPDPPRDALRPGASLMHNVRLTVACSGPWILAGCFFCYVVQWVTLTTWLPTYLVEARGVGVEQAALFTALVVASNIPGNFAGGWLLHHHAPRWLLILVSALATGGSLFGIFDPTLPDGVRVALCLVFTAIGGMLPPAVMSTVPAVAPGPGQVATANGLVIQGSNVGQLVGPVLAAVVVSLTGRWEDTFWLLEVAALLTLVLAALLWRIERRLGLPGV